MQADKKETIMKRQEIIDTVNAIMGEKGDYAAEYIEPDDAVDELGVSSMQCIEALVKIEDEFVIDIPGSELLNVSTMQDVYDLVERKIIEPHGFKVY
jgi:acyl carrier protein